MTKSTIFNRQECLQCGQFFGSCYLRRHKRSCIGKQKIKQQQKSCSRCNKQITVSNFSRHVKKCSVKNQFNLRLQLYQAIQRDQIMKVEEKQQQSTIVSRNRSLFYYSSYYPIDYTYEQKKFKPFNKKIIKIIKQCQFYISNIFSDPMNSFYAQSLDDQIHRVAHWIHILNVQKWKDNYFRSFLAYQILLRYVQKLNGPDRVDLFPKIAFCFLVLAGKMIDQHHEEKQYVYPTYEDYISDQEFAILQEKIIYDLDFNIPFSSQIGLVIRERINIQEKKLRKVNPNLTNQTYELKRKSIVDNYRKAVLKVVKMLKIDDFEDLKSIAFYAASIAQQIPWRKLPHNTWKVVQKIMIYEDPRLLQIQ